MMSSQIDNSFNIEDIAGRISQRAEVHLREQATIDGINERLGELLSWVIENVPVQVGFDFDMESPLIDSIQRSISNDRLKESFRYYRPLGRRIFLDDLIKNLGRVLIIAELSKFTDEFDSTLPTVKYRKRILRKFADDLLDPALRNESLRSELTSEEATQLRHAVERQMREYEYNLQLAENAKRLMPLLVERLTPENFYDELVTAVKERLSAVVPTAQRWEVSPKAEYNSAGRLDINSITSTEFWEGYTGKNREEQETYSDVLWVMTQEIVSNEVKTVIAHFLPTQHAIYEDMFDFLIDHDQEFGDFFESLCAELNNLIMEIPVSELLLPKNE